MGKSTTRESGRGWQILELSSGHSTLATSIRLPSGNV